MRARVAEPTHRVNRVSLPFPNPDTSVYRSQTALGTSMDHLGDMSKVLDDCSGSYSDNNIYEDPDDSYDYFENESIHSSDDDFSNMESGQLDLCNTVITHIFHAMKGTNCS